MITSQQNLKPSKMINMKCPRYVKIQALIVANIYIGQIAVGYSFGWISIIISKLKDPEQSPLDSISSEQAVSWVVPVSFTTGIVGSVCISFFSNFLGRKQCLIFSACIYMVSSVILALSNNIAMFFCARAMYCFSLSIINITHLVYIGEIASTPLRGIFLVLTGITLNIGILFIYAVGPIVSYAALNYISLGMGILYSGGLILIPESPLYLMTKNKEKEAKKVLEFLDRDEDFESLVSFIEEMKSNKNKWTEVVTMKSNRKALFILIILSIIQQSTGQLTVLAFVSTIFELANSSVNIYTSSIIIALTQIIAGGIAPFFVERSGRKSLLIFSTAICFLSMVLLATYFYLDEIKSPVAKSINWLPLVSLIVFTMSYALGLGIIPSTFIGEVFTSNARTIGATIVVTTGLLWALIISIAFDYLLEYGIHISFWVFSVGCAAGFVFSVLYVPETKGKSLLEVQEMLSG